MTETISAPAEARPRVPPHPGRLSAARTLILVQAPFLLLIGVFYVNRGSPIVPVLCFAGTVILVVGGLRMGRDRAALPGPHMTGNLRAVPWDWTDFIMFWPAAFTASSMLISVTIPLVDQFTGGTDPTVRTAAESFVAQASFYAGALFDIWVLVSLRRGGTLFDVGWRRFSWWWVPGAVVIAAGTLELADILQLYSQRLFPNAQNGQCIAVQHDYSHFLILAVIVVCVIAPLSEETIFRGFIFGWARRAMPIALAVAFNGVIFALLHGEVLLFIPLFAVGVVLALVYQFSRSLVPGALVHALFNLPGIIAILSSPTC